MSNMDTTIGCALFNTKRDKVLPADFTHESHVHIVVRGGKMSFFDGKNRHTAQTDDLVIWQMSNSISEVTYSDDFDADLFIASPQFLQDFNPEMIWASKGFIFIKINPVFHLDGESLQLIRSDFELLERRLRDNNNLFKREVAGRAFQIFLFDLWTVYQHKMSQMETTDNASRIFLRFLDLVQRDCRRQRDVAFYADRLCITPKYLSQVSNSVSGLPASEWITFYTTFELVSLLNDQSKTLTEVADMMNFETMPHFSRYVKKLLGKSPTAYRQK